MLHTAEHIFSRMDVSPSVAFLSDDVLKPLPWYILILIEITTILYFAGRSCLRRRSDCDAYGSFHSRYGGLEGLRPRQRYFQGLISYVTEEPEHIKMVRPARSVRTSDMPYSEGFLQ